MNRRQTLIAAAALAACGPAITESRGDPPATAFPMRRGVNLGNGLEAPNEGEWGYRVELDHLTAIRDAGFDGVRVPVRWDTHMAARAPFAIASAYFERVELIVRTGLELGLVMQINAHHYGPLLEHPDREMPRARALWRQIAERFADAPPALLFEPFNEPNGEAWTGQRVARTQAAILEEIRPSNPTRLVVLGGPNWNSIDGLFGWTPPSDPHLLSTAHYYEPFALTHQDAEWMGADAPHFGRAWGDPSDLGRMSRDISRAAGWSRTHNLAMQIGEFGVNHRVPMAQRAAWTRAARKTFEEAGLGWCHWDFAAGFPVYDRATRRFIPEMLEALLGA